MKKAKGKRETLEREIGEEKENTAGQGKREKYGTEMGLVENTWEN